MSAMCYCCPNNPDFEYLGLEFGEYEGVYVRWFCGARCRAYWCEHRLTFKPALPEPLPIIRCEVTPPLQTDAVRLWGERLSRLRNDLSLVCGRFMEQFFSAPQRPSLAAIRTGA